MIRSVAALSGGASAVSLFLCMSLVLKMIMQTLVCSFIFKADVGQSQLTLQACCIYSTTCGMTG